MTKFWIVNAESIDYCGVSHSFCVEAPDNYTEDMIKENVPLITTAEEAMLNYLDPEDIEDNEDAMLCSIVDIEEWDDERYGSHELQTWAEHFVIEE